MSIKFYGQIGEMKTELREISEGKSFDMANVSVFYYSQILANTVIEVQEIFVKERTDLKVQFDRTQQEMMKHFCGMPPSETLQTKYQWLKQILFVKK